jgi:ribosomal 30S subunit maturation factor RimM
LDEDEYYDYQLIGLIAVTEKGRVLGKVKHVMHLGSTDMLVVDSPGTQASDRQFIEGEAHRALPDEGATQASDRQFIEGEAHRALPDEGATQAPLIAGSTEILIPMTADHIDRISREKGFILVREEALVE